MLTFWFLFLDLAKIGYFEFWWTIRASRMPNYVAWKTNQVARGRLSSANDMPVFTPENGSFDFDRHHLSSNNIGIET